MMKGNLDGRSENLLGNVLYRVYLDRGGGYREICINIIRKAALRHVLRLWLALASPSSAYYSTI